MDNRQPIADLLIALTDAIDTRNWSEVDKLTSALASRAYEVPLAGGKGALDRLLRAGRLPALQKLAGAMIQVGTVDSSVRFRHVQALLGQGEITASRAILEDILNRNHFSGRERAEMLGLIGESFKQASLATPVPER